MWVTERVPCILYDIDDILLFNGVYYCMLWFGEDEQGEGGDVHEFIMFCHRDKLEIINTYAEFSDVYYYNGNKAQWIALIRSKLYKNWDTAFGLPEGMLENLLGGTSFNMRYRKIY